MEKGAENDKGKDKIGEESRTKEEESIDDLCFTCKDGGLLLLCDHKNCDKAYHPECVGKDNKFLRSAKRWICDWHFCFGCQQSPEFHCMCCSKALCNKCVELAEFVQVKGDKGFCSVCLKLALHTEETADRKSDSTLVAFFRDFWKINNKRERLTLEDLRSADARMKEGKCFVSSSYSDVHNENLNDEMISDSDIDYQMKERPKRMKKGSKGKAPILQRNKKPKTKEFVGWGSRVLIDFLKSINIDVAQALPQKVVTAHIKDYIKENNLFDPEKKKRIICDTKLQTILGRKIVKESKIFYCLDCHFADNQPSSDEDAITLHSKEKVDDVVAYDSRGNSDKDGTFLERNKMMGCGIPQDQFASINPKNISLVYLRHGLVQKFMEDIETFDDKVIGSFVKYKTNPKERRFENPHTLVQVTGITRTPTAENGLKVSLKVSGVEKDICIDTLSNGDVTEEECYELKVCIQEGVLKHPTVAELQQKAMDLHMDIVKHWIARELVMVQEHINRAHERGWKKQLHENLERRELLQSSDEQEKLLNTNLQVVADERGEITPHLFLVGNSETPRHKLEGGQPIMGRDFSKGIKIGSNNDDGSGQRNHQNSSATVTKGDVAVMNRVSPKRIKVCSDNDDEAGQRNYHKNGEKVTKGDTVVICLSSSSEDTMEPTNIDEIGLEIDVSSAANDAEVSVRKGIEYDGPAYQLGAILRNLLYGSQVAGTEQTQSSVARRKLELMDPANSLWNCIVSDGTIQGPYTLSFLKSVADLGSAISKYMVWKSIFP